MLGTDLKPKKNPVIVKIVLWVFVFLSVFLTIFYLYGFLWQKFGARITKSINNSAYIETTGIACKTNADCSAACTYRELTAGLKECLCLNEQCSYVDSVGSFSDSRYCDVDADCTVSCYEGPVSVAYYESVGGAVRDCSEGCLSISRGSDGHPDPTVCKNHQCEYSGNQTCYISSMKR